MSTNRATLAEPRRLIENGFVILIILIAVKLLLHLVTNGLGYYEYHRDELLYMAMAYRLDWGYLEVPPLIALLARFSRTVFGDSVFSLRLLPAIFGTGILLLTGLMTREMGGKRFAVLISGLCVLIAPVYLRGGNLFQPVVFDQFFWVLGAYLIIRILNGGSGRLWVVFGVVAGLGLLNKYSMLFFGFGVLAGLLLTRERRQLRSQWPWIAGILALIFVLPNLYWQWIHGWPILEHMAALSSSQLVYVDRIEFLTEQALIMHPLTFPVWFAGLFFLFKARDGRYRVLFWTYFVVLVTLLWAKGKSYYLAPAYPMLLAAGACYVEDLFEKKKVHWVMPVYAVLLILGGLLTLPMGLPILPPKVMAAYTQASGMAETVNRTETRQVSRLPQDYADMLGWAEMVRSVANVYQRLPAAEREEVVLVGGNYGHAGALDYYGPKYGLPPVVSTNSSFYLWGPGDKPGNVVISLGVDREDFEPFFNSVEDAGLADGHELAREQAVPIYIGREPLQSLQTVWPTLGVSR